MLRWLYTQYVFVFLVFEKMPCWDYLLQLEICKSPREICVFLLFGPSWMCISGAIYCSICVDPAQPTFFDRCFVFFWEKCSPPSLGSMIFKAACMQNFEKLTPWPSKLIEQVPLWKDLLHFKINKNASKNEYFLFMAPLGKLGFALCATSPTFWKVFSNFRLVSDVTFWKAFVPSCL